MWKQVGLTPDSGDGIGTFSSTGNFNVSGNIMSLYYGDEFIGQKDLTGKNFAFCVLFSGCNKLVNAENLILPATTLTDNCYAYMFNDCTSLTSAPSILPATTLTNYCYSGMFNGCTSLTIAPELPATTLDSNCYESMFYSCTSLVKAPQLPATTLAYGCYYGMFQGCTSLTTAPELPATTLADNCYLNMFFDCTSLTTAPELPATTLADYCYNGMFYGCTLLNYIKCLATNISANNCTDGWVTNVAATGTFVKDASMTSWTTGDNGIPSGWVVMNDEDDEDSDDIDINEVGSVTKGSSGFTITIDDNELENGTYKMIYEDSTRTPLENVDEITEFTII